MINRLLLILRFLTLMLIAMVGSPFMLLLMIAWIFTGNYKIIERAFDNFYNLSHRWLD